MIRTIVSGGQAGADRAGLDFAIARGLDHEGWCPKGREALDGPIDDRYRLRETPGSGYLIRTGWNVRDSDGTVIFTLGPNLTRGSKKTADYARKYDKPWIHLHRESADLPGQLAEFLDTNRIEALNVAGSREKTGESIYAFVLNSLEQAIPRPGSPAPNSPEAA